MKFKKIEDEKLWNKIPPDAKAARLREMVRAIDTITQALGLGEVTITSYAYDRSDSNSHNSFHAADLRCHPNDKPMEWYWGIGLLSMRLDQSLWRVNMHTGDWTHPNEHIHVQAK